MPFVVDASAALTWSFSDEATPATLALLASLTRDHAVAPAMWPFEIANALLVATRRGRATTDDADGYLFDLLMLPIRIEPTPNAIALGISVALARAHRLSIYDAAYLELALRLKLPLATNDGDMAMAAKTEGVKLLL